MAAPKVPEAVVLDKVSEVFRMYGYEGASISLLSKATGLERASLYHRFPGGKEEMAAAVVRRTAEWFQTHVINPLSDKSRDPGVRVRTVAGHLRTFYRRGTLWCVLDCMTIGGSDPIHDAVRQATVAWLDAFARVARESGASATEARVRAQQAVVEIQGALVLSRVSGSGKVFLQILDKLPALLTSTRE